MSKATIYHNPRCSKSRQTLALLEEKGVEVEVVPYLEDSPSIEKLDALCRMLDVEPIEITRVKEARFRELGLSKTAELSREEWLVILHENPVLIERPIVECRSKAAVGRPPENVLDIL